MLLKTCEKNTTLRMIDANLNRLTEGLRVCEDITRFVLNDRSLQTALKIIRHEVRSLNAEITSRFDMISARNIEKDVGRHSTASELNRKCFLDIFIANAQRVKESIRTLEEICKLLDPDISSGFKKLRFNFYTEEKNTLTSLLKHEHQPMHILE